MEKTKKKILIAEDEPATMRAMADSIKSAGFEVIKATDGEQAVEFALRDHPDCILMDIRMPKMDGLTALKRIRKNEWGKDVCITILTNISDSAKVDEALKDGAFEYLIKADWDIDKIVKKLKTRLGVE
ncbi:MAG: hypothetical protein A3J93_04595 [Candidatus Magasanikbacteria bacterium RIFOXYC2_FULL_42_28]|uniref:Response regulatory domain-containing protein n=1 Tax=Candidatus Magasanikbacteria bacterium RIFOXYC2_FULL_42_28 TaxID=1798704 RepID=A0A1F6NXS0_9BACT|nr:MAG: hypothetical protein A3J93_04595 [Candidatus Magasanikbacteria bacterium RIFOXYC2_FULL_42_28]